MEQGLLHGQGPPLLPRALGAPLRPSLSSETAGSERPVAVVCGASRIIEFELKRKLYKEIRGTLLWMRHRCICSGYSVKAPPPAKNRARTEAAATRLLSPRGRAWPWGGRSRRPRARQVACGQSPPSRQAAESHICASPRQRREGTWRPAVGGSAPNQSAPATASPGGVCYHSFFFSSMETPPGPSATTSSRPPITDMVWKKSYLRKSCMGL